MGIGPVREISICFELHNSIKAQEQNEVSGIIRSIKEVLTTKNGQIEIYHNVFPNRP